MDSSTPNIDKDQAETDAIEIRTATVDDVPEVIRLLWDDDHGRNRESIASDDVAAYQSAFREIESDTNSQVIVACQQGVVVGCLQITIIPGLSYRGVHRALIEDVRVDRSCRSRGIGKRLLDHAEAKAIERDCELLELFVHSDRDDAHRFYERAGYLGAHRGFRKILR